MEQFGNSHISCVSKGNRAEDHYFAKGRTVQAWFQRRWQCLGEISNQFPTNIVAFVLLAETNFYLPNSGLTIQMEEHILSGSNTSIPLTLHPISSIISS